MRSFFIVGLIFLLTALAQAQSAGDTQPSLIYRSEPEFSAEAARARVQSTVVLDIVVGEDGKAHNIRVAKGAGFGLDEKAVEIMDKWRFNPGTHEGRAVPLPAQVELNFNILIRNDREDHTGQRARLNFTLPADTARPELAIGMLPGNPAAAGDQSLRFHLEIDAQGTPRNVTVVSSNDKVWEKQVLHVIEAWRFRPATSNGAAVSVEGVFEMEHSGPAQAPVQIVLQDAGSDENPTQHMPVSLPVAGLIARSNHTATRLANGTVLIAGGADQHELVSAQTFDWVTRSIVNTGSMLAARRNHTATLLRDGTVLIAGGDAGGHALSSAEIFDPSTGKFSGASSLHEARQSQAAAMLPDGRVLICGGTGIDGKLLASAEIYDPRVKAFVTAATMTVSRTSFSVVPLKDGRVLLAGGDGASAEVFNPESGGFSATGNMTAAPIAVSATLLNNGQALIVGGSDAEIFDPVTNSFHTAGAVTVGRERPLVVSLPSGKVLITDGNIRTAIYDPVTGTFSPGPILADMQLGHTATLLENGSVLVAGHSAELLTVQ